LQQQLEALGCDLFVTGDNRAAYYFTGSFSADGSPTVFALWQDGATVLVTPSAGEALADQIRRVETYSIQRAITQPWQDAARLFADALPGGKPSRRAAIDRAGCPWLLQDAVRAGEIIDAAEMMLSLRKCKEEDEISEIRASLHLCATAYRAARQTIAPGLTEIDIYNSLHAAINREAGTSVLFPGDFACGERGIKEGGPPTPRTIQPHDLYILDLFPAPAFYSGDTCRTFAAGTPTDLQYRAWELICEAIRLAEGAIRPGVFARAVYAQVKELLDGHELTQSTFWHHAGHGIGYSGHEAPRLIPGCGDVFEVGDVLTLEPGVYSAALQGGIRIEDNYAVREHGLENLFSFVPRDL
jgi:Xaa-Pro aminopeptidase